MVVCKFYQQGRCIYGTACRNSHLTPAAPIQPCLVQLGIPDEYATFNATATVLKSSAKLEDRVNYGPRGGSQKVKLGKPCWFYQQDRCVKGEDCQFMHTKTSADRGETQVDTVCLSPLFSACRPTSSYEAPCEDFQTLRQRHDTPILYQMGGAEVTFSPGIEISSLDFPSDYSAIQISNLPKDYSISTIQQLLISSGLDVPTTAIEYKGGIGAVEIRVRSPSFSASASEILQDYDLEVEGIRFDDVPVKSSLKPTAVPLELGCVHCSWFKPSLVATVLMRSHWEAIHAAKAKDNSSLTGRIIRCQCDIGGDLITVENLHPETTKDELGAIFPDHEEIFLSAASYSLINIAHYVQELIQESFAIEHFHVHAPTASGQERATIQFRQHESAVQAIEKFSGKVQSIPNGPNTFLFNSPIYMDHCNFVKLQVRSDIFDVLAKDFEALQVTLIQRKIKLHVFMAEKRLQGQRTIGIESDEDDLKDLLDAKCAVEKMIAGQPAMKDGSILWDDFFLHQEGLEYLNEFRQAHSVYVYCDAHRHQLQLYGSESNRTQVFEILEQKISGLLMESQIIHLSEKWLYNALHGAFRKILFELGKDSARFDIGQKAIFIRGSPASQVRAIEILDAFNSKFRRTTFEEGKETCPICWTSPENPYKTRCGHKYCRTCFENQMRSSIDNGMFPITCSGNQATCLSPFKESELRNALPPTLFEELLRGSFKLYVRTRPQEFQYCGTPDCDEIFRVGTYGKVFRCSTCLMGTCTSCHSPEHEGLTCEEALDLAAGGDLAVRRYKRDHQIKDCPKCKTSIEKIAGCNHMKCLVCKAHICWICMEPFENSGLVYAHMEAAHGDLGI